MGGEIGNKKPIIMDWVEINTVLLVIVLGLLIHAKLTALTAEQILLYLGLNNDEIREVLSGDKEDLIRILKGLKIDISDQVIKDLENKKKRNDRKN